MRIKIALLLGWFQNLEFISMYQGFWGFFGGFLFFFFTIFIFLKFLNGKCTIVE